jgi:Zn-dependent metalloprotease
MAERAARLQTLRYEAALDEAVPPGETSVAPHSFRGGPAGDEDVDAETFNSDEAAARFYLDHLLVEDDRPMMRSIARPDRPERVPDLVLDSERDLTLTSTRQVRFTQTHRRIPIFGAKAVVEMTPERDLVALEGRLGEVIDVSPVEDLSSRDALQRIAELVGNELDPGLAAGAKLNFFKGSSSGVDRWHLVWVLTDLFVAPPQVDDPSLPGESGHALGRRPPPAFTYLVDAHDGEVVYWFSRVPSIVAPTRGRGLDEDGVEHRFYCLEGDTFGLEDTLRRLKTYDLRFADLVSDPPLPAATISNVVPNFSDTNRAGVTAHVNAGRVQDFFRSVLQRDGIDDKGMTLVSLVNCCSSNMQPPPELLNAFWWKGKMWYGQIDVNGRIVSLSRHLDVIAHELTHGVVQYTAGLHYRDESGALNESFADAFGIIIRNWYLASDREDPSTWSWEIGAGLKAGGEPLRDLSDPARCRQPAHVSDQYRGPGDNGGVHINSGIPNKAVHLLLTATDSDGQRVLSVEDVAVILYIALTKLTETAQFTDLRAAALQTARTYFRGSENSAEKVSAVEDAYDAVGIT